MERELGKIMTVELESMAVAMPEVPGHPNRAAFRGVLTVVDVASKKAPSGSKGHVVLLTRKAAEAALPSLLGMALDYAPSFDRHDVRRKVGVITQAEVVGKNLEISGFVYARDFPDVVDEITQSSRGGAKLKTPARQADRSSELQAVSEASESWLRGLAKTHSWKSSVSSAVERIRKLTMGSAATRESGGSERTVLAQARAAGRRELLRRDKAAYPDTWIEISKQ